MEAVDPKFVTEGLLRAREKTIAGLATLRGELKEGMTEDEARKLALRVFREQGVTKHWHKPYIRFGAGTTLTFNDPLQPDYRLQTGDPYYIDLGPVWSDPELGLEYEGDYGDTFVFGENAEAEKCAATARQLFGEAKSAWRSQSLSGQGLYEFLRRRSHEMGYLLVDGVEGHRVADFPHHRYSKAQLATVPFFPSAAVWVLELQLNDPQRRFGAFFEDLL